MNAAIKGIFITAICNLQLLETSISCGYHLIVKLLLASEMKPPSHKMHMIFLYIYISSAP